MLLHLLLNTLLQSFDLYLVTDTQGDIFHISPDLEKELGLSASEVIWRPIMQLMPVDQSACIHALFGSFFRVGATGAIQMLDPSLQPNGFFGDFWRDLEATGSWSGDIFNQRRGGQVYFQWQTVRAAQNGIGETLVYVCAFNDMSQPQDVDQQLARFSLDDALICLPSRPLFEQRLTQAMLQAVAQNTRLWVFSLGLDGFKAIVDALGHTCLPFAKQALCPRKVLKFGANEVPVYSNRLFKWSSHESVKGADPLDVLLVRTASCVTYLSLTTIPISAVCSA
jgi:hypothetical protein